MIIEYQDNRLRRPRTVKRAGQYVGVYRMRTELEDDLRINVVSVKDTPTTVYIDLPSNVKLEVRSA